MPVPITEILANHIITVYNAMEEDSIEQADIRVFTGSLSKIIRELGISMTYYKPIFRALYDGGYCAMVDRGGRSKPSTVALIQRPRSDELMHLTTLDGYPIVPLVNRIEALESSTGGMFIAGALQELDSRLSALEGKRGKK